MPDDMVHAFPRLLAGRQLAMEHTVARGSSRFDPMLSSEMDRSPMSMVP